MKIVIIEKIGRISRNRKDLETALDVKLNTNKNEVLINGAAEDEFTAEKVIDALNFGFPISVAFLIKKEDFLFEGLNIKDFTKRRDLATIRARIIGREGKTLRTLTTLTDCFFELKDNCVGIIGSPENIKRAQDAVIRLIQGSKQANVYKFLEQHKIEPVIDLGLKPLRKKKK